MEAKELLTFLLGTDASVTSLTTSILERTDGTPFFIEEVVQTLVEEEMLIGKRGQYHLETTPDELQISPTVQGVLAARIDRLTREEKALLLQLAVIGRQFPASLVKQVVSQSEADLYHILASLQAKEFLYEQPAFPESEYIFKHALTQDVAYGTVLQHRKSMHERTGQAIEALYAENLDDHYSELAYHYSHSTNNEKAIAYLGLAGQQAVQRSAYSEAVSFMTRAVTLIQQLPDTPENRRQELALQTTLGSILITTEGCGARETEHAYTRAYTLCQQLGETSQLFAILWRLDQLQVARSNYQKAWEYGEQMLSLAQREHDSALLSWSYRVLAEIAFCMGELSVAKTDCEDSLALSDPQQRRAQIRAYGEDPALGSPCWLSVDLFLKGYPDQAMQVLHEALTSVQELENANSLAATSIWLAFIHSHRRELDEARGYIEAVVALATEQGMPFWLAWGTIMQGWVLSAQGDGEGGIAALRQGLTMYQVAEETQFSTCWHALLAEAYGKNGQVDESLSTVGEALDFVEKTNERFYQAELYRLQGEMTLQPSKREEAEACFRQAIEIAQKQEAKSWELRAATSLARLWQGQGKKQEARDLISPVYNWFTEGFDTADLKDAKALLDELS